MSERRPGAGKGGAALWVAGLAVGVGVHIAGIAFFRVSGTGGAEMAEADYSFASLPAMAQEGSEGDILREYAFLFDSAPLFLPTRWNSAAAPAAGVLEQRPPELFDYFPARFSYGEADFGLGAIEPREPELDMATLDAIEGGGFFPFGREPLAAPDIMKRFAVIEVRHLGEGEVVLSGVVPADAAPADARQLWPPAEFLVHVTGVGVLGEMVLLKGSGVEEIDQFLRESIREALSSRMLETGYFHILAGP